MNKPSTIDIEKEYREDILNVWNRFSTIDILSHKDSEYRKYPLAPKEIQKDAIIFIGINPSFGNGAVIQENEKPIAFYTKSKETKDIPYFEKIKNIANYCKTDWEHIDLLFIRETDQKLIEKLSYTNVEFINAQLKITFEIIEKAEPKLILVANSFASEFFGKMKAKHSEYTQIWQGHDFFFDNNNQWNKESTFDSNIGTYRISLGKQNIPIIFSGMLSGQRALDIGSYERLKWQIKMILEVDRNP
jgi:hypothetical protein